ncbi:MAG: hypothetical protein OJI67_05445 [Prosthecobacter sp.]|nr:hypothetical protein [Prosthecobacter sp.]
MNEPPDFLVLYAVLEHLLPKERTYILGMMRETIEGGGSVFFAETPNRLIPFDSHSSQLQFTQSLPPELALRYSSKSKHQSWKWSLDQMGSNLDALFRCGLGLSYHDFELDLFDDTRLLPLAFSGWCGELLGHQAIQNDERWLLSYFNANSMPVHPAFSRYWLEGLLSKRASQFHQFTCIGRIDGDQQAPEVRAESWNHPLFLVSRGKPIVADFKFPENSSDDFEVIIQISDSSLPELLIVHFNGSKIELACGASENMWHRTKSLHFRLPKAPQSLSIGCDSGKAEIRAVIINGYTRSLGH